MISKSRTNQNFGTLIDITFRF